MASYPRALVAGLIGSAAATYAKTLAEGQLQPRAEKLFPPAPGQKSEMIGADPAGHPENMPPTVMVDRAVEASGSNLGDTGRDRISSSLHWVMGMGFGTLYALTAERRPLVRAGAGTAAGAALFGATHASTLPATGFQDPVSQLPRAWWIWEGGSHLIYGAALDGSTRLARAVLDRLG